MMMHMVVMLMSMKLKNYSKVLGSENAMRAVNKVLKWDYGHVACYSFHVDVNEKYQKHQNKDQEY